jgi:NHLM bacteriocin system ABC transporter ATP-binding protein
MGIYDEQIKQRIQSDADRFTNSFIGLSGVVMGDIPALELAASEKSKNAIAEILKFYRVKARELPENITDINDQMDYLLNPIGVMRRMVKLNDNWHKKAIGAMLATLKNSDDPNEPGDIIALIPRKISGYNYYNFRLGKRIRVTKAEAAKINEDAVCFYKPLPLKKITAKDFLVFCLRSLSAGDFVVMTILMLAVSLIGLLTPYFTNLLFMSTMQLGGGEVVIPAAAVLVGAAISAGLIRASQRIVETRINTRSGLAISAAMMARILALPANFFKDKSSGEISQRLTAAEGICSMFINACFTTTLTSVLSLMYVGQIFVYAPVLVVPAILVILATLIVSLITSFVQLSHSKKMMEASAEESGLVFSLIRGVPKLKLSGSERRAFAKWSDTYVKSAKLRYSPPFIVKFSNVFSVFISSVGIVVMYYFAVTGGVSMPDYMAFNAAYGQVSSAFVALTGAALAIANIAVQLRFMKPILEAIPETADGKKIITKLSGGIEISNVFFRYNENMPFVLNDITLRILSGQYVAIVGATGCGKSTLLRLLLGFETPGKGAVYYDGKDLSGIELKSLRKNIGVVTQDGKLFQGDVFSNIIISAPQLTMDDAWEAAELAGIADDIRAMPMGMHTIISEGGGGLSGGQKQRLMIARAIAPKPKILILDEATSALDNITQKHVSDALAGLKCTRIVIAHRLSTIKQATRIILLDGGKIAEDGTYDGLMEKNGLFADLVRRQMVTKNDAD